MLKAIGVREDAAVLRFSLAGTTTLEEILGAAAALREAVQEVGAVAGRTSSRGRQGR